MSWIADNGLYEIIKKDGYDMIRKGNRSEELSSIANFLDEIDNEYIKNKEDAQEGLDIVKEDVSSKSLKEIVKELEKAIFGYDGDGGDGDDKDDKDDKDDGSDKDDKDDRGDKDDGKSIGERVKLKNEDKISKKEFKEKYARGYEKLDEITKSYLGLTYNPEPGEEATFKGF